MTAHRIDAVYAKLSPWLFFFWLLCVAALLILLIMPFQAV
jgi:hypothetical protein